LFNCFPDAAVLANADLQELENLVRSTGFYRKAKNIQAACGLIQTEFGGHAATDGTVVAATRSGTQDSQCGSRSCLRIHVGVTVDTHVKRLSYRLIDCSYRSDPIERDLTAAARVEKLVNSAHLPRSSNL